MSNSITIYKEKTIESAINTIITKMQDIYGLPEKDREQARRRWIWELMQNASDCAKEDKVSIKIEFIGNHLKFSHNGSIFTYRNLVDLITQISSKRTKEEQIGKFGTGFISTHLISPIVNISGIYHSDEKSTGYKKLDLCIDRSNLDQHYIKKNIEKALNDLDEIDAQPDLCNSIEKGFHTHFSYDIKSDRDILGSIKIGLEDLDRCIGYVFAFNKKIEKVQYNKYVYSIETIEYIDNFISKIIVKKTNTDTAEIGLKTILTCCENENLILATEITKEEKEYACKETTAIPRLFCTFPLIGTEKFAFPVIINSSKLEISQERNSIHESENNKNIICKAIQLYDQLLKYANENDYKTIYNICKMHKPNNKNSWHDNIFSKIENIYLNKGIIPCIDSSGTQRKVSMKSDEKFNLIVPYMEEEDNRDEFWELIHTLKAILPQPLKSEYVEWAKLLTPARITPQLIFKFLLNEGKNSLATLKNHFNTWPDMFNWLNAFYGFCVKSNIDLITLPNQKGEFADISKLKLDKDIDEKLKDILLHLSGVDIKTSLINKKITLNHLVIKCLSIDVYDNQFVAKKIAEKVREHISKEGAGEKRIHETQKIFNELTDWFERNPEISKELFKDIYESRFQLTTKEETIRRLEVASKVEQAISENNIALEAALSVIQNSVKIIQSIENGEIVVNEETRKLFQHISSSSPYAKEKIDSMIERSISAIHKELAINPNYSVAHDLQQWKQEKYSTTVFKATRMKDNVEIRIIIRPSDGNKIIFYEDTELDALDDIDYELWTCDENCNVKMLTLGDILKTTGINVIPLRKI